MHLALSLRRSQQNFWLGPMSAAPALFTAVVYDQPHAAPAVAQVDDSHPERGHQDREAHRAAAAQRGEQQTPAASGWSVTASLTVVLSMVLQHDILPATSCTLASCQH